MSVMNTPLNPTFIEQKLGMQGLGYTYFSYLLQNIDCGYSLEPPQGSLFPEAVPMGTHNQRFEQK